MGSKVVMPQLGESVVEGKISKWLKQVGDPVALYDPILEVETDKVTTEVTAAGEGTLLQAYVAEGDVVAVGKLVAYIGRAGETPPAGDAPQEAARAPEAEPAPAPAAPVAPQPESLRAPRPHGGGNGKRVSPVVARIAAEHNVDVSIIAGTGLDGRVTKQDILAHIERGGTAAPVSAPPVAPRPPAGPSEPPPAAPGEVLSLSSMRRSIADHMVRSKHTSPHVTTVFEVDLSRVVAHRSANQAGFERDGARLTFTPYFLAAAVAALKQHPLVNSSWSDAGIVLHRQVNVGLAVSLGAEGLIVPVIKNADSMNLLGLARAVNDLADRARGKQLKPDEVQGGTFTLTNHGTSGSLFATPIINQPQCGILGVGMIQKRAVVVTQDGVDAIAIKPMAYLGLTFDHRILDGNSADNFVAAIKRSLENWA